MRLERSGRQRGRPGAQSWVYHDRRWPAVRRAVFARDGRRCRIGLDGCTGWADTIDHVIELEDGGAPFDLANLQPACRHCNSVKALEASRARSKSDGDGEIFRPEGW